MDWLTFIATMTGELRWVILAALFVWPFRRELSSLLTNFGRRRFNIKRGDTEVTVSEELDKIEESLDSNETKAIIAESTAQIKSVTAELTAQSGLSAEAAKPPEFLIWEAWIRLINAVYDAVQDDGTPPNRPRARTRLASDLKRAVDKGLISHDDAQEIIRLQHIRDFALHDNRVATTLTDALRYVGLANTFVEKLSKPQPYPT